MSESSIQEARELLADLAGRGVHRLRRDDPTSPWEAVGGGMTDAEDDLLGRLSALSDSGLGEATEIGLTGDGTVVHAAKPENSAGEDTPPPDGSGSTSKWMN